MEKQDVIQWIIATIGFIFMVVLPLLATLFPKITVYILLNYRMF